VPDPAWAAWQWHFQRPSRPPPETKLATNKHWCENKPKNHQKTTKTTKTNKHMLKTVKSESETAVKLMNLMLFYILFGGFYRESLPQGVETQHHNQNPTYLTGDFNQQKELGMSHLASSKLIGTFRIYSPTDPRIKHMGTEPHTNGNTWPKQLDTVRYAFEYTVCTWF